MNLTSRFISLFCLLLSFGLNAQTTSVTYSVPGSSTFTVPNGVTQITVEVWGAGGAGGTIDGNGNPHNRGAGGGGGGAYARKDISVTPNDNITYTIGAGATTTSNGGDTFFLNTTTVMAKGGISALGGRNSSGALGGSATSSIGTFKYSGGNGANGTTSTTYGGGGGSSAGNGSNGISAVASTGAIAPSGGGAGGNGKTGADGSGFIGISPGGGGGGALKSINGIQIGGNGGDGKIKISWIIAQSNPPIVNNGTNATCNSFSANWSAVSNATAYFLDVSTVNTFATFVTGYNNRNVGNVLTYSVTGLNPVTTYYYRLRALTNLGTSGNSGTATYTTLLLSTPTVPGIIDGTTTQCPSLKEQTYTISAVPNATIYTWTVPAGWTIMSGAGTTNITVTTGTSGGNITVTAGNTCGASAPRSLAINVNPSSIDFDGLDDYIDFSNVHNQTGLFSMEAWVLQEAATSTGAIISKGDVKSGWGNQRGYHLVLDNGKPTLIWYNNSGTKILNLKSANAITNNKWHHIAAVYNGADALLYVDGVEVKRGRPYASPVSGTESFLVGAMYDSSEPTNPQNYFNGFIDEVRVWDIALTEQQIQEMMNQEIELNGNSVKGKIIPKDVSGGLLWANLKGYYPMNDGTATDQSSNSINGIPKNICLSQSQTAPLPYETISEGNWTTQSTWLHGDVWDMENISNNAWSIIHIKNDVTTSNSHYNLGLIVDANKTFTVNGDNLIYNSSYLELNGTLDLKDDSQLIQSKNSDLVTNANGKILRRRDGNSNVYWYNYFSSPVGAVSPAILSNNNASSNNANNTSYKLNFLKYGNQEKALFTSSYNEVGKISTRWLYTYKNGVDYNAWASLSTGSDIQPGVGYSQKGTGNSGEHQQYIFEGKPNNGTILVPVTDVGGPGSDSGTSKTEYLLGNPYPSALDIRKFIDDNEGIIKGTLQLWQQWSGSSHNLSEYNGGYAQVNKTGSVRASQFSGLLGFIFGSNNGTQKPTRYLPVGQGFIAEVISNGNVVFNNDQRVFIKEADAFGFNYGSVFFRGSTDKTKSTGIEEKEDIMQKIRLEMNSVSGPASRREVLLAFSEFTTDDFDYGYDAFNPEDIATDLNSILDDQNLLIQAYSRLTSDKVVPLNFRSSGDFIFEISMTEFEDIDDDQEIYLKDNLMGIYFDLRIQQAYRFTSTEGEFKDRFEIVFQNEETLGTEKYEHVYNLIYFNIKTGKLFVKGLDAEVNNLKVINIIGQTVREFNRLTPETLDSGLSIPNLSSGIYIVYFKTDTMTKTKKILID